MILIGRKKDEERPVAVISFGNEKKETKPGTVIGSNAIWGDQFILKIEDAFDFIEITVFSGKIFGPKPDPNQTQTGPKQDQN